LCGFDPLFKEHGKVPSSFGPRKHGVIPARVVAAIDRFFAIRDWDGLWLTGGTCLSEYYFGHRLSVDIDLFTAEDDLFQAARASLQQPQVFGKLGDVQTVRVTPLFCQFLLRCPTGETVKIDLAKDIPVKLAEKVRCGQVWLDSLPDLASNKVGCLVHREDVKDYVDLYYLLPRLGLDAESALQLGLEKEAGLDPLIVAAQLQFIQTQPKPSFLVADIDWDEVKDYFSRFRAEVLRLVQPR
jgi:hypothetical protein